MITAAVGRVTAADHERGSGVKHARRRSDGMLLREWLFRKLVPHISRSVAGVFMETFRRN